MFTTMMRTIRFGDWWSDAIGIEWVDRAYRDSDETVDDEPGERAW
jgi:hypothetical protein